MSVKNEEMCVYSTTEYTEIKHIQGNRLVNPRNVELIKVSMSDKQLIVPAILNENMEVIDGQHRLEACKQLSLPFYYIVVDGYHLHEVQKINANMKNWSLPDFLDSFIDLYKLGNHEYRHYVELKNFMDDTGLPIATALALSDLTAHRNILLESFKNGEFQFRDINTARQIADALKDFEQYDAHKWKQSSFAKVFSSLYLNDAYSHDMMLKNLPFKWDLLKLMGNDTSTRTYLIDIYNHRTPRAKKLYAPEIIDAWKDMTGV